MIAAARRHPLSRFFAFATTLAALGLAAPSLSSDAHAADLAAKKSSRAAKSQAAKALLASNSSSAQHGVAPSGASAQSNTTARIARATALQSDPLAEARRRRQEEKERARAREQGTERAWAGTATDVRSAWADRSAVGHGLQPHLPGQPASDGAANSASAKRAEMMKSLRDRWQNEVSGGGTEVTLLDPRSPKIPQNGTGTSREDWLKLRDIARRDPTDASTSGNGGWGTPSVAKGKKKEPECKAGDPLCAAVTSANEEVFGNPCGIDGCPETPAAEFSCGGGFGNSYCRCQAHCAENGYDEETLYGKDDLKGGNATTKQEQGKTKEQQQTQKASGFLCSVFGIGCDASADTAAKQEEAKKQDEEKKKQEEAKKEEDEKKKGDSQPNCSIASSEDCYEFTNDEAWKWKQQQREEELRSLMPKYQGSGDVDPLPDGAGERIAVGNAGWHHDAPVDPPDDQVARGPSLPDCSLAPGEGAIDPTDGAGGGAPGGDFSHCEQDLPSFDRADLSHLFGKDDDDSNDAGKANKTAGATATSGFHPISNSGSPGGR